MQLLGGLANDTSSTPILLAKLFSQLTHERMCLSVCGILEQICNFGSWANDIAGTPIIPPQQLFSQLAHERTRLSVCGILEKSSIVH